jgi:hypothetical protein
MNDQMTSRSLVNKPLLAQLVEFVHNALFFFSVQQDSE